MSVVKKNKCNKCKRKLTQFSEWVCKCSGTFCSMCRLPFDHECTVNYFIENKKDLEKINIKVECSKVQKIE